MMKIEHIAMYVQDLEKTRDFFVKYFAAKSNAMYHNPNFIFLPVLTLKKKWFTRSKAVL